MKVICMKSQNKTILFMKTKTKIWIYPLAIMGVLLLLTGSCKKKDNNDSPTTIAIGSSYAGGIIFSIDSTGQHGLVCAPNDQNYNNDELYIANRDCNDLVLNGYDDWSLPSKESLNQMFVNLHKHGLGAFKSSDYWSSTVFNYYFAWSQNFNDGSQNLTKTTSSIYFRAVRAF